MGKYLMLDIGAGTLDILYLDTKTRLHYKAVVKSPVRDIAERIGNIKGRLIVTGCEMGGGFVSESLKKRAAVSDVVISASAALTLHHDPERVKSFGINIIDDDEADRMTTESPDHALTLEDIQIERILNIVKGFGVTPSFDAVAVCAQDHGTPPDGVSHLDFRHNLFKKTLDQHPYPGALLYRSEHVPAVMNRLSSIARSTHRLPTERVYVMDSGMAAILGASMDPMAGLHDRIIVVDIATSHTVGAAMEKGVLAGFFEYHTTDITPNRLDHLLKALPDGTLSHKAILKEGGHGAYIRHALGFDTVQLILATGPKRGMMKHTRLPILPGAPWGDNMMTGAVGLFEAMRQKEEIEPVDII